MDIEALMNLADPMMSSISPEMLQKLSKIAGKLGTRMQETGESFSIDSIKAMIEPRPKYD